MPSQSNDPDDLSARIKALKDQRDARLNKGTQSSSASGWAKGSRMAADLVAGVLVGLFIGWVLDRMLGTSPWLLIVCLMFGSAAGLMNVIRAAQAMNASDGSPDSDRDTSDPASGT